MLKITRVLYETEPKQRERRRGEKGHVYVIAWSPRGPSKIGRADNPVQRLSDLQIGNPYRLRIYFAAALLGQETVAEFEALVHARLQQHRLIGEWFGIGPSLARSCVIGTLDENGQAWRRWKPSSQELDRRLAVIDPARRERGAKRVREAISEREWQRREFGGG